uniref:Uncharacterized protein n=1 Tax=Streptomyces albus subsp. albus TaxID=67257 RepID=H1ZZP9_9ACTN|nr:hypothetical protein [Streptomyces albus subsp. albus]
MPPLGSGSPPLARRKHHRGRPPPARRRLTSARAEKTATARTAPTWSPAHLRSRGENEGTTTRTPTFNGSPPLARRKRAEAAREETEHRLTSARAEKTTLVTSNASVRPAHLRSRGENPLQGADAVRVVGSPPLARRKHFLTCNVRGALPFHCQA